MTKKPVNPNFTYQVGDKKVKLAPTEDELKQEAEASLDRLAGLLEDTTKAQSGIDKMLAEREGFYGNFVNQSMISRELKFVMQDTFDWTSLASFQQEALEMIQHKIARILNGDPAYVDSWQDIAGYATLVVNELKSEKG